MKSYIYLASPYTDKDPQVRELRYEIVEKIAASLMQQGFHIFSPIVHCHPMAVKYSLPKEIDFWHEYDRMMLSKSALVLVARIDGWRESKGVAFEMNLARELKIPVVYIDQETEEGK